VFVRLLDMCMSYSLLKASPLTAIWGASSANSSMSPARIAGTLPRSLYGYEIIDFIGEGAGSTIYSVVDPATQKIYALKHVVVQNEKHLRFVAQLENEYEVSRHLIHPNLRRCIDLKITKPLLRHPTDAGLVMELFDGQACDVQPPRDLATIMHVMEHTIQALAAMHQQGYLHCDLKPNNILLASDGQVKVIDLGQACRINTIKERVQGTPDFIAPEQVRREPLTVQTDVYNFGATVYWLLTGQKIPTLFTLKKTDNSFLVSDTVKSPNELNSQISVNLSGLVMECVRAHPSRRPAGMGELQHRLTIVAHTALRAG